MGLWAPPPLQLCKHPWRIGRCPDLLYGSPSLSLSPRFYTLLVLSTALFGKPPFKNVIVNGLVLARWVSRL